MERKKEREPYFSKFRISDWPLSDEAVRLLSGGVMIRCSKNDRIAKFIEDVSNDYRKAMLSEHKDKNLSNIRSKYVKFNDTVLDCRRKDFDGVIIDADMEKFNEIAERYRCFVCLHKSNACEK